MSSDTKIKELSSGLLKQFWPTTSCERMPYSPNTRKRTHKHTRLLQFAVFPLLFYAKPVKMDRTHWGTCKLTHQAVWDVLKRPTFVHLGKGWWAPPPQFPKLFVPTAASLWTTCWTAAEAAQTLSLCEVSPSARLHCLTLKHLSRSSHRQEFTRHAATSHGEYLFWLMNITTRARAGERKAGLRGGEGALE